MKNLRVSLKLIISFIIVILFAILVGATGIIGMYQMNAADDALYTMDLLAVEAMGRIESSFAEQRVQVRNCVIYDAEHPTFKSSVARLDTEIEVFKEALDSYELTVTDPTDRQNTDIIRTKYDEFIVYMEQLKQLGAEDRNTEAQSIMDNNMVPIASVIVAAIDENSAIKTKAAEDAVNSNTKLFTSMAITEIVMIVIAIIVSLFLAFYISRLISKPLRDMMGYIKQAGETGNLKFRDDEWANCDRLSLIKDEIGQTMKAFTQMMRKFVYYGETLNTVSQKNLNLTVETLGEKDTFGNAMSSLVEGMNMMFGEINTASNQVSSGSVQIADGSQMLAQGATEQSATVQQLSASVNEVNDRTKANAELANDAKKLGEDIKKNAEHGNDQMAQMVRAVEEISDSSTAIEKVIKIIDDIAFQTNILALNAAVEAARAGQHGKGFAVVADEVRSLAAKSAEAAKNTSELIATSIEKSGQGAIIARETAESLEHIVTGIIQSSTLVNKIAESSNDQSIAIAQIGEAIEQVSHVVQQNSATAEEAAAASEEMSSQAAMLQQLIGQFKLKNPGNQTPNVYKAKFTPTHQPPASNDGFMIHMDNKY
jgi:methyl-accepting chemotaxis protein